jgi:protein SCO1/2
MWKPTALAALALAVAVGSLAARRHCEEALARHDGSGVVLAAPEHGRVRIRHDAIAGYMPAMAMEFDVRDGSGDALAPGDSVRFALRVGSARSWIEDVEVTGHAQATTGERPALGSVVRLHEGDALSQLTLVDQDGATVSGDDFEGRLTVLTFIFTRCPVPDYCPLVSRRFVQIQSALAADRSLPRDVRLLSITIDPAFDTPPVLKAYAQALGADPVRWRFAGGDPIEVQRVARAFSVYVERNGALLDHTLATALIDRSGHVVTIWRGNSWNVTEVVDAVRLAGDAARARECRGVRAAKPLG